MEEKIEFERVFRLLDSDYDILLFTYNGETFTVAKFKELLRADFSDKFHKGLTINDQNIPIERRAGTSITSLLYELKTGQTQINRSELIWKSTIIDCQFLKIGSKGWEKGKLRIQVIADNRNSIKVSLEFSPDEPSQPESLLDDLRELPEYKQQM